MGKLQNNNKGFSAIEGLLIVLVLAVIGFGGYYVWHTQHQSKTSTSIIASASSKNSPSTSKQAITTTPNPYAGWKSYTLTDEKLSFQYPPTWQITDYTNTGTGNQDYHADWVTLKSNDNFEFDINDGLLGAGDPMPLISKDPVAVTYAGQSAYMVFYATGNMGAPGSVNYSQVAGFRLLTNPSQQGSIPNNKNVTVHMASYFSASASSSSSSAPGQMLISGGYNNISKFPSSVEQAMQDKEYQNAKLVIESMHY